MIRLGKITPDLMNRAARAVAAAAELPQVKWYAIHNRTGDNDEPATLDIYGEIGFFGVTAQQFNDDLRGITARKVDMRVSSPGGDVFDAVAIYNLIRSHPAHFTARVDGLAASAASVIIQAADERVMMPHSQQMIHKAWAMTIGNSDDHMDTVNLLNKQDDIIASIYHERTRGGARKLDKIRQALAAETWFTDDEAVAFGLADRVEKPSWQAEAPDDDPDDDDGEGDDAAASAAAEIEVEAEAITPVGDAANQADAVATLLRELDDLDELDDLEALLS